MMFSRYLDYLQSQGQYWFIASEVQRNLGLSDSAMSMVLWRLGKKQVICRIKKEFYVIVPPEHRSSGCLPAQWFIDPLMTYIGLPYYVSLLSAASLKGAAHQQVMILQVMTTKSLRNIVVGNQHIHFYSKPTIDKSLLQVKKNPISYFNVSRPELTVFDLIRYASGLGQLQQAATVIYELVDSLDVLTLSELVSEKKVSIPTAQRLGYLLENVISIDNNLNHFNLTVNAYKPRYIPLISGKVHTGYEKNKRWRVLVNERIEVDEI
ncbi:MAG: type IV toxin-antitoxin system AbiEi family antitoxin [Coxiellaceae bacterium]|nr:type IV toxin-antitoxin system AbiEi family antitoxin [Coxiellaceae bacterium]